MASGGMVLIKYLLFFFNFIFWVSGMCLIGIGAWVKAKYGDFIQLSDSSLTSGPVFLIIIGVIVALVGFLGCCGAYKENYCMVTTTIVLHIPMNSAAVMGLLHACFFLRNTTSLIQPMDQGVLQAMKNQYKRKLLQKVICTQDVDQTQSIKDVVKLHTVKDALYMLCDAWDEASPESIRKAYNKLKIHSDNSQPNLEPEEQHSAESMVEMLQRVQQVGNEDLLNAHDLEDWLNLDNELPTTEQMSDEQILATVTGHPNENESSDEEDDSKEEKQVSNSEAAECFKKCFSWMEGQNNVDPVQVMQLRRKMDFAMRSHYKTLKQTSVLQFFRNDE